MSKLDDLSKLNSQQAAPRVYVPPPRLPDEVKKRFPALAQWESDFLKWSEKNFHGASGGAVKPQ